MTLSQQPSLLQTLALSSVVSDSLRPGGPWSSRLLQGNPRISQARVLEWAAMSFARGSFPPGDEPVSPASAAGSGRCCMVALPRKPRPRFTSLLNFCDYKRLPPGGGGPRSRALTPSTRQNAYCFLAGKMQLRSTCIPRGLRTTPSAPCTLCEEPFESPL